jgi:hypothetical protein
MSIILGIDGAPSIVDLKTWYDRVMATGQQEEEP